MFFSIYSARVCRRSDFSAVHESATISNVLPVQRLVAGCGTIGIVRFPYGNRSDALDEASIVLNHLHARLPAVFPDLVRRSEMAGTQLLLCDGYLRLTTSVHHDPDAHPAIAHCHVIANLGNDQSGNLDACVMGIGADRRLSLEAAAVSWTVSVAPVIFSVLKSGPVSDAEHFDGHESFAVPGCHGFLGPLNARLAPEGFDPILLLELPLFEFAEAMAPSGKLHLAKVTLAAKPDGTWSRSLEVDGHRAALSDAGCAGLPSVPASGVFTRFAVFHYGERHAERNREREQLDLAIRKFVEVFCTVDNQDAAAGLMREAGCDSAVVDRVTNFLPIAAGRVIFENLVPSFPAHYVRVKQDGECVFDLPLMGEPAFARSIMLIRELLSSGQFVEGCKKTSVLGPELAAINEALQHGSKAADLVLAPSIIPDPGTSELTVQHALQLLLERMQGQSGDVSRKKPWWRFW